MMKKLFTYLFLIFLFSSNSFGLTKKMEDEYFQDCMVGASESNRSEKVKRIYCICVVDYMDERFSDESFIKFANGPKSQTDKFLNTIANLCNTKVDDIE